MNTETDLARILSVPEMITKRNNLLELAQAIVDIKTRIDQIGTELSSYLEYASSNFERDNYRKDTIRAYVDKFVWLALVDQNKITNAMTESAKDAFKSTLDKDPPQFNETEIAAFAQNAQRLYIDSATQTFRDVFKEFTDCNYGKWNDPKKSNINFIAPTFRVHVGARRGYGGGMELGHYNRSLQDLLTAAHLADQDRTDGTETLDRIIRKAHEADKYADTFTTPYFSFQLFLNGNALVKWHPAKQHILDQINRFGASGELPDTLNRKYKPEHFEERKAA